MLKIKDNVDLKELEKFGFEYYIDIRRNNDEPQYYKGIKNYIEKGYRLDDGENTIEIIEERKDANWVFLNKEREVYVYESDYDMGVSEKMLDVLFDLIQAGLVEKVVEE